MLKTPLLCHGITILVLAVLGGVLAYGVFEGPAAEVMKALFVLFLVMLVVSLFRRRKPTI